MQRGLRPPLIPWGNRDMRGDVRTSYEFPPRGLPSGRAFVQFTRLGPSSSSQAPYPSFCPLGGKSSVAPLLLLSPPNPLCWALAGAPYASTLFPRTHEYCTHCGENVGTERITSVVLALQSGGCGSLQSFHRHCEPVTDVTGVAIRAPLPCWLTKYLQKEYGLPRQCAHWLAMTSENRKHYCNLGSAARRAHGNSVLATRHARLNRVGNVVAKRCAQSTSGWGSY